MSSQREKELEADLLRLYHEWARLPIPAGKTRPYYARRFLQTIVPGYVRYKGGIKAVKDVVHKQGTGGFDRLRDYPHLTVEHFVISGKWDDLFNMDDRAVARRKLAGSR